MPDEPLGEIPWLTGPALALEDGCGSLQAGFARPPWMSLDRIAVELLMGEGSDDAFVGIGINPNFAVGRPTSDYEVPPTPFRNMLTRWDGEARSK